MRELLQTDFARRANRGWAVHLTLAVFRLGQQSQAFPLRWIWRIGDRTFVRLVMGAELPPTVTCGPGLALPHAGRGVIFHPDAQIGANCMIFHRVTLAATDRGAPVLGDDVIVGAGALVLGPVHVGSGAKIGANCVIVGDIPPGAIVHAAPAVTIVR